jgi:hypothetical protein
MQHWFTITTTTITATASASTTTATDSTTTVDYSTTTDSITTKHSITTSLSDTTKSASNSTAFSHLSNWTKWRSGPKYTTKSTNVADSTRSNWPIVGIQPTTKPAYPVRWGEWQTASTAVLSAGTTVSTSAPQKWSDWDNLSVSTITLTATYIVPCPTGWKTKTTVMLTTHCGCTETEVPSKPAMTTVVTTVPESWVLAKQLLLQYQLHHPLVLVATSYLYLPRICL